MYANYSLAVTLQLRHNEGLAVSKTG